ncbi:MAG: hypothetical protein ACOX52_16480 [Verrucomicrobiota bacterium]
MEPNHPDRWVENASASSAGGSPNPDGEVRSGSGYRSGRAPANPGSPDACCCMVPWVTQHRAVKKIGTGAKV